MKFEWHVNEKWEHAVLVRGRYSAAVWTSGGRWYWRADTEGAPFIPGRSYYNMFDAALDASACVMANGWDHDYEILHVDPKTRYTANPVTSIVVGDHVGGARELENGRYEWSVRGPNFKGGEDRPLPTLYLARKKASTALIKAEGLLSLAGAPHKAAPPKVDIRAAAKRKDAVLDTLAIRLGLRHDGKHLLLPVNATPDTALELEAAIRKILKADEKGRTDNDDCAI